MMYASKIIVDKRPKMIIKTIRKSIGYDKNLTINLLKSLKIKDDEEFSIYEDENNKELIIEYSVSRKETKKETADRVKKEIQYNKNYDAFHLKYK